MSGVLSGGADRKGGTGGAAGPGWVRGGYVVGAMWDEGNMVHAIWRFGGTTMG